MVLLYRYNSLILIKYLHFESELCDFEKKLYFWTLFKVNSNKCYLKDKNNQWSKKKSQSPFYII